MESGAGEGIFQQVIRKVPLVPESSRQAVAHNMFDPRPRNLALKPPANLVIHLLWPQQHLQRSRQKQINRQAPTARLRQMSHSLTSAGQFSQLLKFLPKEQTLQHPTHNSSLASSVETAGQILSTVHLLRQVPLGN